MQYPLVERHFQAVFIAIGINAEGRRQILGVELSNRESRSSWTAFVNGLKTRGLHGVEFVVSDDHAGLKRAVRELLPEAVWQRCYVHFLRNALDYLPRKADDDCRQELRWLYDRRNLKEAQQDLQAWLTRWAQRYPKLTDWVEAHIGETLNFYSLPRQHHKHLKSTNMLERLNEEIKRRTRVVRIFPNPASCLRLVLRFRILTSKHPADLRLEARLRSASSWSRERWNPFRRFGLWRQPSSSDNDAAFVSTSGGTQSGNGVSSTRWWPAGVCTSTIWVTERGGHQNGRGRPRVCLNIPWTVAFPLPERKVVRQSWPPTDRSHSVTGSERLVSWP